MLNQWLRVVGGEVRVLHIIEVEAIDRQLFVRMRRGGLAKVRDLRPGEDEVDAEEELERYLRSGGW